jgi:FKBP-type peptidyl-prolyl cis-trans isomerase
MLSGMKSGEIQKVIVLSKMAYGINAYYSKEIKGKKRFVISPNTSLVYQIKVLEVK